MNKRAQGLPMSTIVLIIMVLLVLAAVGIMFFSQFGTGQSGTSSAQCIQLCGSIRSQMSSNPKTTWSTLTLTPTGAVKDFCDNCKTYECKVRLNADGSLDEGVRTGNNC